jgi:hypothetical protein
MSKEEQVLIKVVSGLHAGKTFSQEYDISQGFPHVKPISFEARDLIFLNMS